MESRGTQSRIVNCTFVVYSRTRRPTIRERLAALLAWAKRNDRPAPEDEDDDLLWDPMVW